jgi:hypothetical protein
MNEVFYGSNIRCRFIDKGLAKNLTMPYLCENLMSFLRVIKKQNLKKKLLADLKLALIRMKYRLGCPERNPSIIVFFPNILDSDLKPGY